MKKIQFLFMGWTLILYACGAASPTPSPAASFPTDTPFPIPSATETVVPTFTATPYISPTPSLPDDLTANQISPILYTSYPNFILLGAVAGDRWLNAGEVAGIFQQDRVYDFYMSDMKLDSGTARIEPQQNSGPPGSCEFYSVELSSFVIGGTPPTFGLAAGQAAVIRPVEEIEKDNPVYRQFIADWLSLQEVPDAIVNINRIVKVDIEGDGVDEVLINASNFKEQSGHLVETGDYSVVLMRKVIGDTVYTVPLAADVYHGKTPSLRYPQTYFLENVFDLNGDGKLEVILGGIWWESRGLFVYEIYGIDATEVLSVTCGYVTRN